MKASPTLKNVVGIRPAKRSACWRFQHKIDTCAGNACCRLSSKRLFRPTAFVGRVSDSVTRQNSPGMSGYAMLTRPTLMASTFLSFPNST